jgi:hypothetical protein
MEKMRIESFGVAEHKVALAGQCTWMLQKVREHWRKPVPTTDMIMQVPGLAKQAGKGAVHGFCTNNRLLCLQTAWFFAVLVCGARAVYELLRFPWRKKPYLLEFTDEVSAACALLTSDYGSLSSSSSPQEIRLVEVPPIPKKFIEGCFGDQQARVDGLVGPRRPYSVACRRKPPEGGRSRTRGA